MKTPVPAIEVETTAAEELKTAPLVAVDETGKTSEVAQAMPARAPDPALRPTLDLHRFRPLTEAVRPPRYAETPAGTRMPHTASVLPLLGLAGLLSLALVCRPWISLQAPASLQGLEARRLQSAVAFSDGPRRGGGTVLRDIFILGLAIAAQTFPAQVPAVEASEQPFKLSATAELVLLDVSVKDAAGEHVANLSKRQLPDL